MEIAALRPSEPTEFLSKFHKPRAGFRIAFSEAHQHADPSHRFALLRVRHKRPRGSHAAHECDEVASSHANCPSRIKPTKGQRCASQQNWLANDAMGHERQIDKLATWAAFPL